MKITASIYKNKSLVDVMMEENIFFIELIMGKKVM